MTKKDVGLTFAGGGNKSFYQFGLMRRLLRERLLSRVGGIAACSAGACMAALLLSGRTAALEEFWRRERAGLRSNFEWRRLFSGHSPLPHESLYRAALLHAFSDGGYERIRSQPFPILVLTTGLPKRMPALAAAVLGLCVYNLDKRELGKRRGAPLALRAGFMPMVYDARDCQSPAELADLIIATSSTPPFTSLGRFAGRRLLDGGIIDTAPTFLVEGLPRIKRHIVLLTSSLRVNSEDGAAKRFYMAPSTNLLVKSWDLTRPHLIEEVIAQGERDADIYHARLTAFLDDEPATPTE